MIILLLHFQMTPFRKWIPTFFFKCFNELMVINDNLNESVAGQVSSFFIWYDVSVFYCGRKSRLISWAEVP